MTKSEETLRAFDDADLPRQFEAGADAVADARIALDDALAAAWIPTAANAMPPGLSDGEYRKMLQEIRAQRGGGPPAAAIATHAFSSENVKAPVAHAPAPLQFARPNLPADAVRPPEYYAGIAVAASWVRDLILGLFVVSGGMIIFMPAYIGTFPDFAAALLWGFSVNLGAETVTAYAAPLLARRPFA